MLNADPFTKGLVRLIGSTKHLPDHLTLPPMGGMGTTLESELAEVVLIPDETVRHGLEQAVAHSWKDHDLTWLSGRDWSTRTAELFRDVWRDHLAADWPRRRALLERDVTYRAGLLAAYGWPRALQQMSRRSARVGTDAIRFSDRPGPDRNVGANGMLFVPVTKQRGSWLCKGPAGPPALVYPARGTGETAGPGRTARALARLLGPGRATILRELESPAPSSELAAQLDQSLGTIGGHLAARGRGAPPSTPPCRRPRRSPRGWATRGAAPPSRSSRASSTRSPRPRATRCSPKRSAPASR
ncbi:MULTISPECIES: transcriptional regulator [unclassified Streptomyces]|uniref:transcriptional regulator n=1 Tax=unclassified Streptomyces TaxID=2593676 RepID=UPI00336AEC0D